MPISENADDPVLDLSPEVVERVVTELDGRGEKAVAALRTAAVLIEQAVHDGAGLRLAESAAYNLREALEAVVAGRTPAPGGLPIVIEAWERFEREVVQPDNDSIDSLETFRAVLRKATERQDRGSYHEAKLLNYLRDQSGVDPLAGGLDPIAEYKRLRKTASQGLHRDTALDTVTELYQRTLAWFVRMFTPPDSVVLALRELATEPWRGPDQIERLRQLVSNPHHLRLLFTHLTDPAWLFPLHEAGVVPLPTPEATWPLAGLMEGLGRTAPAAVTALLQQLLTDCKHHLRPEQRLDARFKLLILATQLGPDGHTIVGAIVDMHPDNRAVRSLASGAVKQADPAAPIVARVSNVVLNAGPLDHDRYYYRLLLEQLEKGLDSDNAETRTELVAAKLRRAAEQQVAGWISHGIARLTTELGEDDRYFLVVAPHYLARMTARAHTLGVPSQRLLDGVTQIPGEIGERLACRILARAEDFPLQDKIEHITRRLASQAATGDDKDLVDAIVAADPTPSQLTPWSEALGLPSHATDTSALPRDWMKTWQWSAILPAHLLAVWQAPIAEVSARYGRITPEMFDHRTPTSFMMSGQSAYQAEELAALPVLSAASLVAKWRPDADSDARMVGARELARILQTVVAGHPQAWTEDPTAVVETLREPVYVLHYFYALAEKAADVVAQTGEILAAAQLVKTELWQPTELGDATFDFEPDWHRVDTAVVDVITKLADRDASFAEQLETAWTWALAAVHAPSDTNNSTMDDHLTRAINNPRGRGLQTVLSLAAWEYRNLAAIRSQFVDTLDSLLQTTGQVGMEYRAILASQRPRLERIAADWLDQRVDALFRDDELGPATVDLTLTYARYTTPWLYQTLREDIIAAAIRGTEAAIASLLIGTLKNELGYDIDITIAALHKEPTILASAAAVVAHLVQDSSADAPELETAVRFWRALLDANRDIVPTDVLRHTGRWAFVAGLADSKWTRLTLQSLVLTGGLIDYAIEVADRCESAPIPGDSTKILLLLQGRGEPWENHHIAQVALTALRALSTARSDENFLALRTRLIELGHGEAAALTPYDD